MYHHTKPTFFFEGGKLREWWWEVGTEREVCMKKGRKDLV
jgi:hypothetical protein